MIDFAWPFSFLLLLVPLLMYKFVVRKNRQEQIIDAPTLPYLAARVNLSQRGIKLNRLLTVLLWAVLTVALARPQWLDEPIIQTTPSRDLVIAVDVSKSMDITDMSVNGVVSSRIQMVKSYIQSFVKQRKGDRISFIVFADHAYLMVPFTQNTEALQVKPLPCQSKRCCKNHSRIKRWF